MIDFAQYRRFWMSVPDRVPEISDVIAVTVDDALSKKVSSLPLDSMSLFYLPPSGDGHGSGRDDFSEKNVCVFFILQKFDPQRREAVDVLEMTHPVVQRVKELLLEAFGLPCAPLAIDVASVNTLPETSFFSGWAGWSVGFSALDN